MEPSESSGASGAKESSEAGRARRRLGSSPRVLPLYARAALPLLPFARHLPLIPGGGGEVPPVELELLGARADPERLRAYREVCGFRTMQTLPGTFPHVLAFPLHMALMTDGRFPLAPIGLVHIENRITVHRPIAPGEGLDLRVWATPLRPHPRGRAFTIATEARVENELVWAEESVNLRRERRSSESIGMRAEAPAAGGPARRSRREPPVLAAWELGSDLGRRYAAVSGDRNPIHLHDLSARLLGFPRAIAHGMWSAARCLAALEERTTAASYAVEVRFRKPILLPARVAFAAGRGREHVDFAVRGGDGETVHLEGRIDAG
jgi:acyl dehydratase